jgi:dimethylamine monooxygenase subunit A
MTPILQKTLPFAPWMDPRTSRLPGVLPLEGDDWLRVDDAYAAQMAERDRLIATVPELVSATLPQGSAAAAELYQMVLEVLTRTSGYRVTASSVTRPDGLEVPLDVTAPLPTLGRLIQEDLCILEAGNDGHIMTAAILCFPSGWTLAQKIGQPLIRIHRPVPPYTGDIARRVQRLFDAIRPGQVLWRANAHVHADPSLFRPHLEGEEVPRLSDAPYLRSERQCFVRLPQTHAVVFSIHTYLLRRTDLTPDQQATLAVLHA